VQIRSKYSTIVAFLWQEDKDSTKQNKTAKLIIIIAATSLKYHLIILLTLVYFQIVWKSLKVIQIFKQGDKTDIGSYYPIFILSTFLKF